MKALIICRAIVEAHGGSIRACRSPLGGAGFVFSLPVETPSDVPEPALFSPELSHD